MNQPRSPKTAVTIAYEWADAVGLSHLSDDVMDKLVAAIDDELLNAVKIGRSEALNKQY